jgi:hypothetical protein
MVYSSPTLLYFLYLSRKYFDLRKKVFDVRIYFDFNLFIFTFTVRKNSYKHYQRKNVFNKVPDIYPTLTKLQILEGFP